MNITMLENNMRAASNSLKISLLIRIVLKKSKINSQKSESSTLKEG